MALTLKAKTQKNTILENENLILDIPIEFLPQFLTNPINSLRDFVCIPTNAIRPFFHDVEELDECLLDENKKLIWNPFDSEADPPEFDDSLYCNDSYYRYLHIDLSINKDGAGISMCHIPRWVTVQRSIENKETQTFDIVETIQPFIKFDFVGRIMAKKGKEINVPDVIDLVTELKEVRGYDIKLLTYDRFESTTAIQLLRQQGFVCSKLSIDRTAFKIVVNYDKENFVERISTDGQYNSAFETLRTAINESRASIPEHKDWYQETRGLEYIADKDRVVKSPHSSDDLLQSIAGSAYNAVNNELEDYIEMNDEAVADHHLERQDYQQNVDYSKEINMSDRYEAYNTGVL